MSHFANVLGINMSLKSDPNLHIYKILNQANDIYKNNLQQNRSAMLYLYNRKITDDMILEFDIGFAPNSFDTISKIVKQAGAKQIGDAKDAGLIKTSERIKGSFFDYFKNRIMIPIKNKNGNIIAFGGRTIEKDNNVKYINSPETAVFKKRGVF